MSDIAFEQLRDAINRCIDRQSLWLVDESINHAQISTIQPRANLLAMSNRYDVVQQLKKNGIDARLSDFNFSQLDIAIDAIYFRVCKEKAIVHRIINQARKTLAVDGELYLSGFKNEGIKTYVDKAAVLMNTQAKKNKGGKTALLAVIENTAESNGDLEGDLDDKDYTSFVDLDLNGSTKIISKPGVFGWNKIDRGSEFLIEHLPDVLTSFSNQPIDVIDIGCGYGYLTVMANTIIAPGSRFLATDNNIAAVECCKRNFSRFDISGDAVVDDCAESVNEKFDLVLCNPPFHQGFDIESDLTSKFLMTARRLLKKGGCAFFVVNSFIAIEKKAATIFDDVSMLENNGSFKLIVLR
jgi:16S rRNA (guanine1207-N2)-methyltransferase